MELDFSLLNQRRQRTEPTQKAETNPNGEYKNTPQTEKLAEALKRALNGEPEKEAFPDMDITKYCKEAQQQITAMMIVQYVLDHIGEMPAEDALAQTLRALSVLLEEEYLSSFILQLTPQ